MLAVIHVAGSRELSLKMNGLFVAASLCMCDCIFIMQNTVSEWAYAAFD